MAECELSSDIFALQTRTELRKACCLYLLHRSYYSCSQKRISQTPIDRKCEKPAANRSHPTWSWAKRAQTKFSSPCCETSPSARTSSVSADQIVHFYKRPRVSLSTSSNGIKTRQLHNRVSYQKCAADQGSRCLSFILLCTRKAHESPEGGLSACNRRRYARSLVAKNPSSKARARGLYMLTFSLGAQLVQKQGVPVRPAPVDVRFQAHCSEGHLGSVFEQK